MSEPLDPQLLLQHAGWLQTLVRGLIRGEEEVEDVLQDTWVAALERPPRKHGALPAWLARVARNLAFNRVRGKDRLARRERATARPEGMRSTGELVERAELHRQVVQAVLALEEPYRSTLLMRYFENLTPKEIARRSGIPPGTVRSRIKRGLARLRGHFVRSCNGGRDAWCATLLPLALPHFSAPAADTAGVAMGAIAMSTKTKIVLVLLPILGVSLGVAGHAALSPRHASGARALRSSETAQVAVLRRKNERLEQENAVLSDRIAALEADSGTAGHQSREERDAQRSPRSEKGLDAIDWDAWAPRLKKLVERGSPTDPELIAATRGLIDAIVENVELPGDEVRLSDLFHTPPVGSRLATAALAEASGGLDPAARDALRGHIEAALAEVEARLPKEPLGVERMAAVFQKLTLVETALAQRTNADTAARAMQWLEPLWQRKYWSRLRVGALDKERFVAMQLQSMVAIVSLDAAGKKHAEDLLGRAWSETKRTHTELVRRFGLDTVRAALLPVGAGGRDEETLGRERQNSGFAGKQRLIHSALAQIQSRHEREFFGSLNREQQRAYRSMTGSVMLFDIK